MKAKGTKDGVNFRTMDALLDHAHQEAVDDLIALGYSKPDAEQIASEQSEGRDLVIQNPDGTFRLYEPRAGDELQTTPEALEVSRLANES